MHMLPRVQSVKALPEYRLELTFTSGEIGIYDCRPLLHFGVFAELQDEEYFRQVELVNGTVAWPQNIDFDPDTLYLDSRRVSDAHAA